MALPYIVRFRRQVVFLTADLSDKNLKIWFLNYQYLAGVLDVAPVSGNSEQGYSVSLVLRHRKPWNE